MSLLYRFLKRLFMPLVDMLIWSKFFFNRLVNYKSRIPLFDNDGLLILDNFLDYNDLHVIETVKNEVLNKNSYSTSGQLSGRIFSQTVIDNRLIPICEKFEGVARKYFGTDKIKVELTYFQKSVPKNDVNNIPGGGFHLDDNKPNIKFFTYLSDVDINSGPFVVVPGTHILDFKKIFRFLTWSIFKNRSSLYANVSLSKKLEGSKKRMMGNYGFCFLVNTLAWHKAENVSSGSRTVFVVSFNQA